jgi:peptide-methionine (S)-S-oxide reductase
MRPSLSGLFLAFALIVMSSVAGAAETGATPGLAKAIFAGGCFWCEEAAFDSLPGVTSVVSGYTGGKKTNPTYEETSAGGTGHAESVLVTFDPTKITYEKLLDVFWHNVDPLTANAQFCDHGTQYRSAIFYLDETQKQLAEASKAALTKSGRFKQPIVTEITAASAVWPAEDYNKQYHLKNPLRYKYYRYGCGRDQRLQELWGPPASGS